MMNLEVIDLAAEPLRRELAYRKGRNEAYSLRAFSRFLQIAPGRLSELLGGKRPVTEKLIGRFSVSLKLSEAQRAEWVALVQKEKKRKGPVRYFARRERNADLERHHLLREEQIQVISDWYHYAILNLLRTDEFKSDAKWIAKRLGREVPEVRQALKRLESLQLIKLENGVWRRTKEQLRGGSDIPSQAIRKMHGQTLNLAASSLHSVANDLRDISSMTMATSPAKLAIAKKLIQDFRRNLAELMEEGPRTEVYSLCIALFPLSRSADPEGRLL